MELLHLLVLIISQSPSIINNCKISKVIWLVSFASEIPEVPVLISLDYTLSDLPKLAT